MTTKRFLIACCLALGAPVSAAARDVGPFDLVGRAEPGAARGDEAAGRSIDLDLLIEASVGDGKGESQAGQGPRTVGVGLAALARLADSVRIGAGVGIHRWVGPARVPGPVVNGAPSEFLLLPGLVVVPLVLKLALSGRAEGVIEPALAVGWVGGSLYRTGTVRLDYDSSPGFGAQVAVGLEVRTFGPVGLSVRAGYRALKPSLVCVRGFVGQGPPQPLAHPEPVDVDLSGPFWNVGLTLRL